MNFGNFALFLLLLGANSLFFGSNINNVRIVGVVAMTIVTLLLVVLNILFSPWWMIILVILFTAGILAMHIMDTHKNSIPLLIAYTLAVVGSLLIGILGLFI